MIDALDTAAAGMAAQQQRMDAVANDLANTNTTGYKTERVGFRDLVYQQEGRSAATGVRTGRGAAAVQVGRDFQQGSLQNTGRPLDVAINGHGFFTVKLADGTTALTRDGDFQVNAKRQLTTNTGNLVQPAITIPDGVPLDKVSIGADGTVQADNKPIGKLAVVTVASEDGLRALGGNAFLATPASGAATAAPTTTTLVQGTLEMSNTDVGAAMAAMIEAQRSYQLVSKAISNADEMMGIANQVKK